MLVWPPNCHDGWPLFENQCSFIRSQALLKESDKFSTVCSYVFHSFLGNCNLFLIFCMKLCIYNIYNIYHIYKIFWHQIDTIFRRYNSDLSFFLLSVILWVPTCFKVCTMKGISKVYCCHTFYYDWHTFKPYSSIVQVKSISFFFDRGVLYEKSGIEASGCDHSTKKDSLTGF